MKNDLLEQSCHLVCSAGLSGHRFPVQSSLFPIARPLFQNTTGSFYDSIPEETPSSMNLPKHEEK